MLVLEYNHKSDQFQYTKVLGDEDGIWDLWYILTTNNIKDIDKITVKNLDGEVIDMGKGIKYISSKSSRLSY